MRYFLILILVVCSFKSKSQVGTFYSTDQSISNSLINCIYQDSKGYIWIATEDGLNKFDGYRFSIYKNISDDSSSLKNNFVRVVGEDTKLRLWIGCVNGLLLYNRECDNFEEVVVKRNGKNIYPQVTSICEHHNGEVWMATAGEGILTVRPDSKEVSVYEEINSKLSSLSLSYLYEDSQHRVWIASEDNGLNLCYPESKEVRRFKAPSVFQSNDITTICEDKYHRILVGTLSSGLYIYNEQLRYFEPAKYAPDNALRIKSLFCNTQGDVCIGTDGQGLKVFNPELNQVEENPLFSPYFDFQKAKIHALTEDKEGNLWLGLFQKGVQVLPAHSRGFDYYGYLSPENNNIGSNCITAICKCENGDLWVGTDNDGLYYINKEKSSQHYPLTTSSGANTIMAILKDTRERLWIGSYVNGLQLYTRQGITITPEEIFKGEANIPNNKVTCIAEDLNGNIWTGTYGFGVFRISPNCTDIHQFASDDTLKSPASRWINCILCDQKNNIWFGTYRGMSCYNSEAGDWHTYTVEDSKIPGNLVFALHEDAEGFIWIGTTEGLSKFNPKKEEFQSFTMKDGLPSNMICHIEEDKSGNIWLSTHYGISQYIRETEHFENYYSFDGLQSNEFYHGSGFCAEDGEIFFGGIKGITAFYPEKISNRTHIGNTLITNLLLYGKGVHQGSRSGKYSIMKEAVEDATEFTFNWKDNAFTFEFSCMQFANPESIRYEYKLEGISRDWTMTQPGSNQATFTNLSPGEYKLNFRARINENISETRQVLINITPPWYLSFQAFILWGILGILFMYAMGMYVYARIKHRHEIMQRQHAEQIQEAKLQFFINISHEIRTPMTLIINPLEKLIKEEKETTKKAAYSMIYRNAQRILHLINQLMDIRKLDKGQMEMKFRQTDLIAFINDIVLNFNSWADKKHITFQFSHTDKSMYAWIDRENFDKIVMNILSNAFKYTPDNGAISISIVSGIDERLHSPLRNYIEISVTDSGIGIENTQLEKIFERFYQIKNDITASQPGTGIGLHLSRSLVELHHGTLIAERRADAQGSRFVIRIPEGSDHLSADEIQSENTAIVLSSPKVYIPQNSVEKSISEPQQKQPSHKLLLVEDDEEIRNYISRELSTDFVISTAGDGNAALASIVREEPDLIISDVMMPEMDGFTLCKKIKQNTELNHIPVILLSARAQTEDTLTGLDLGADAYLAKPFNMDVLRSTALNQIHNRERIRTNLQTQQNEHKIEKPKLRTADELLFDRIMKVVSNNLSNSKFSVEELANEVGISRVHLHRKLKELSGQTASEFIRNIRLKQAATLFAEKEMGISEVAFAVGFASLSHFSTVFREYFGVSPREYVIEKNKENVGEKRSHS